MLSLSAYIDETGHSKDLQQKFVGMAGLIAPADQWKIFEDKWKNALNQNYINIPFFHMTDFASKKKIYKDWTEPKRQKVFGKLMNVIESIYPLPYGAIIPMDAFRELSKEQQDSFIDPYFLCFQSLVAACTSFLAHKNMPDKEKISLIFSDQTEFRHRALNMYEEVGKVGLYTRRSTTPIFRDMRESLPLQAADIIAYEMYKEFDRRLYRPTAKARFGFERIKLMSKRNGYHPMIRFFTKSDLENLLSDFERAKKVKEYLATKIINSEEKN